MSGSQPTRQMDHAAFPKPISSRAPQALDPIAGGDENLRQWCICNRAALITALRFEAVHEANEPAETRSPETAAGVCLIVWLIHERSAEIGKHKIKLAIEGQSGIAVALGKSFETARAWFDAAVKWGVIMADRRPGAAATVWINWAAILPRIRLAANAGQIDDVDLFTPKPPQSQGGFLDAAAGNSMGGKGGARAERQLNLLFKRAAEQHDEVIQHVSNTGDDIASELRRLFEVLMEALEKGFASLRDDLLNFLKSHLRHGHDHDHGADGIQEKEGSQSKADQPPSINFGRRITREELNDLDAVEELFGVTVAKLPQLWQNIELDRILFFGLAIVAREKENPGGWFNRAVAGKWRSFVTQEAEDRARRAVKQLRD